MFGKNVPDVQIGSGTKGLPETFENQNKNPVNAVDLDVLTHE